MFRIAPAGLNLIAGRRALLQQIPVAVALSLSVIAAPGLVGESPVAPYLLVAAVMGTAIIALAGVLVGTRSHRWVVVIPIIDIVVISLLAGMPLLANLSLLLIFPILWLAAEVTLLALIGLAILPLPLLGFTQFMIPGSAMAAAAGFLPSVSIFVIILVAGVGVNRMAQQGRARLTLIEHQLKSTQAELSSQHELLRSLSHEIKTPLTSVVGYLELALEEASLSVRTRQRLSIALQNSDRLLELLAALLVGRGIRDERNSASAESDANDLEDVVRRAIEAISPISSAAQIGIELKVLSNTRFVFDALAVRQVVDNLLSNAVKFNRDGGSVILTLSVTGEDDNEVVSVVNCSNLGRGQVHLRVTDSGRGMTVDEQTKLFKPFYRTDAVRAAGVPGNGLGLSISRAIMHRIGGELTLESTEGTGTTVVMSLPLLPLPLPLPLAD